MAKRSRKRKPRVLLTLTDDFEPSIKRGLTPSVEVVNARAEADAEGETLAEILEPRIEGHLFTYQLVLDTLAEVHRGIGDTMDFGLQERTRWTAIWEMSGWCIGLCNCMLTQLRAGFASETVPTMRSIHEASQLLTVVTGPGEETLLRSWLDGSYINAQKTRAAEKRIAEPWFRLMAARGIQARGDQYFLGKKVYDALSEPAHNMRGGFLESVSEQLKRFAYGPHPDPVQRAVHVEFGGQQIEEVTMRVGSALTLHFLGPDFYRNTIRDLLASIKAIRETMPVDPVSVRNL